MARKQSSSVNKKNSRYVQGGVTTTFPRRLGWWERRVIKQREDDIFLTVTSSQARRPDIIAQDVYQNSDLTWLVLQYNNIVDVNVELIEGVEIRLPNSQRVFLSILTNSTGGVTARSSAQR